jgi:predicted DNA-binding WGR domain protein
MTGSMHLRRLDPDRNMARFYTMSVQPNLFGEWSFLREWGRIGSAGRLASGCFGARGCSGHGGASQGEAEQRLRVGSLPTSAAPQEPDAITTWLGFLQRANFFCEQMQQRACTNS